MNETRYRIFPDTTIYNCVLDIYVGGSPTTNLKLNQNAKQSRSITK
jgi:hypothetical protein